VHVGTHKTGTTSVQRTFAANADSFAAAGSYFPLAGRPDALSGHHNLAWQLNGDPRFDPACGTVSEMLAELAELRPASAVVSSEDFEYLHAQPRLLAVLADGLREIGYRAVAVVYLRPQAGYVESLYAELVKYGLTQTFDAYLDSILARGEVRYNDRWCFTFDYERLLDGLAVVFGPANVIVRRYDTGAHDVVSDFCHVTGVSASLDAGRIATPGRLNAALTFSGVLRRFEDNVASLHGDSGEYPRPRVRAAGRFDPVQLPDVRRIVERFNSGNRRVFERYRALVPCVSGRDVIADLATALGCNPASRHRRQLLNAHSRPLGTARGKADSSLRAGLRTAALHLGAAARNEAVVVLTAASATLLLLAFGLQSARTAYVEFGLLSLLFAATVTGRVGRSAAEANGIILDVRFFNRSGARLRAAGYALLGLYAVVNAALDVGLPRYAPDPVSLPGLIATAAAALIISIVLVRQRPARAGVSDERSYLAFGAVVVVLEAVHAAAPQWWLDTTLDMIVTALACAKILQLVRTSGFATYK
jgi:hypothetical protein